MLPILKLVEGALLKAAECFAKGEKIPQVVADVLIWGYAQLTSEQKKSIEEFIVDAVASKIWIFLTTGQPLPIEYETETRWEKPVTEIAQATD
jgi:hypothetical protein